MLAIVRVVVFNASFNSISVISWWLVLLVEKTTDMSETLSYNVVANTVHLSRELDSNLQLEW